MSHRLIMLIVSLWASAAAAEVPEAPVPPTPPGPPQTPEPVVEPQPPSAVVTDPPVATDPPVDPRYLDETLIKQDQPPPSTKKSKRRKGLMPQISGYMQVFYKKRFDTDDTNGVEPSLFRVQRLRLRVSGKIIPKVRYQIEIDPRAPEVTGFLRDAFVEFRHIPFHKLRVGQQKTPWGYENTESSSHLYTITRTELAESPGRGLTLRDIGIAIKGRIPLAANWDLEDHVALVNGAGMNVQADDTAMKNLWGRVGARFRLPDRDLVVRAGASFGVGSYREPDDPGPPPVPGFIVSFRRFGADVQVDTRWAFVVAEVAQATDESSLTPDEPDESLAWYVLVAGKTPWNVGPVVRYDTYDLDEFKRWTFGAYWGALDARLRAMATYEVFEDDAGKHDHRLLLWTQVQL
ncbi:MAG: porin [Kofleriaceae bacterium]